MAKTKIDILNLENITKIYSNGIIANKNASFSLKQGEIHALMGENGAGKSTLMKILFGIEKPDSGKIYLNGQLISINDSKEAIAWGIGMVQQHFQLVPSLTVAENLVLGAEPHNGMLFDKKRAVEICNEMSRKYELNVNAEKRVRDISVSEKQKVEILKALLGGAKILILDEPTAVLTPQEITEFFIQLKKLKDKGHTIVFISHRLKEIKEICDRMTIMRNGHTVGVYNTEDCDEQMISRLMVGRDVILKVEKEAAIPQDNVLSVENVSIYNNIGKKVVSNVSFTVRKGEIVGIAAVEGNGQKEIIDVITGFKRYSEGNILINKNEIKSQSISNLRKNSLGYISEDRSTMGAALDASILDNLISLEYRDKTLNRNGLLQPRAIKEFCQRLIKQFEIKCGSELNLVSMLSGGNMQKVIIAREFDRNPSLLIAQQPTRGVDVGSIEFIHKKLIEKRDEGCAILLVSADLKEVLSLSDSLIIMHDGKIAAFFEDASNLEEEEVGFYMLGLKQQSHEEIRRAYHESK